MNLLQLDHWPLQIVCAGMIACAVIDWWKLKVPNYLTFPLVLGGWLLGLLHNFGQFPFEDPLAQNGHGGIGAALACTALGFFLLFPLLAIGGVGQGDVKMQMGFGSFMGAFFGMGNGLWITFFAFCAGAVTGGVISLGMMAVRGEWHRYFEHTRIIWLDLMTQGSIGKIAQKAEERKPTWYKLPYGIPLCIGFLSVLFALSLMGKNPQGTQDSEAPPARSQESGVRSQEPGVRCQESRVRDIGWMGKRTMASFRSLQPIQPILSLQPAKELKLSGSSGRNRPAGIERFHSKALDTYPLAERIVSNGSLVAWTERQHEKRIIDLRNQGKRG